MTDPRVQIAQLEDAEDKFYVIGIGGDLPAPLFTDLAESLQEDFRKSRFMVFNLEVDTDPGSLVIAELTPGEFVEAINFDLEELI